MSAELAITVNGQERTLRLVHDAATGTLRAHLDGQERTVDARQVGPHTWSLIIDHRAVLVDLEPRRGGTYVATARSSALVSVEGAAQHKMRASAQRTGHASGETVAAPIAGRVVKLLVAVGDSVTPGQAVIVLEAMKMENELAAERGGIVDSIKRAVGDTVETGAPLVVLRAPA